MQEKNRYKINDILSYEKKLYIISDRLNACRIYLFVFEKLNKSICDLRCIDEILIVHSDENYKIYFRVVTRLEIYDIIISNNVKFFGRKHTLCVKDF